VLKQRVYIDTSVIGGCFDIEFEEWSNRLFEDFKSGKKIAVVSDVTIDELSDAPQKVRDKFKEIPDANLEVVISDTESRKLADLYLLEGVITKKYYEDAIHIAVSTINQVSVLASWNFKHIVNLDRIRLYNSVNLKNGFSILEIRTPQEIIKFEDNED
jgi:predicted nucleic acid-binding protein